MSPSPFRSAGGPPTRGFVSRILGRSEPEKAAAILRGLLASAPPTQLPPSAIPQALAQFDVRGPEARRVLANLWSEALAALLSDGALDGEEQVYLGQLAAALGLSESETLGPRRATGTSAYKTAVQRVLQDGEVTQAEWASLEALKTALALPDDVHEAVYGPAARATFQQALKAAVSDRRLSPIEQSRLEALAKALHVTINYDRDLEEQLARFALYWRVENGDIPAISVPINLQKGEVAYWQGAVEWHEIRRRTTRISYSGPTVSIPIVKGVRWRIGSFSPSRMTRDELTRIDQGTLYLTNKRMIFDGALKNTTLRHSSVLGFQLFQDGIVVDKASGRSPHLMIEGDTETLAVILGAALAMSGGS